MLTLVVRQLQYSKESPLVALSLVISSRREENTTRKHKPASQLVREADSQARGEQVVETERLAFEFQVQIPLYFNILVPKLKLKLHVIS